MMPHLSPSPRSAPGRVIPRVAAAVASAPALAAPRLALAASSAISGGIEVESGLSTGATWFLSICALIFGAIFIWRGVALATAGRNALAGVGFAIVGMILAFGGALLPMHFGYG